MPLVKRPVEPVNVSRSVVPSKVTNELECVANSTLTHIVRQLGSLSAHADDLFSELHRDAASVLYRVVQLSERVERVKGRIVKLNPTVEEVLLQDINMRKPFKSSVIKEQQTVTQATRPSAVTLMYQCCEPAPALQILNPYREDNRDSLKFYTDPGYFLELWCLEMTKDTENQLKKSKHRGRRSAQRSSKEPRTIRAPKTQHANYAELRHGPEFVDNLRHVHDGRPTHAAVSRQSTAQAEHRPSKADLQRTASLQSSSSAVARSTDMRPTSVLSSSSGGNREGGIPSPRSYQTAQGATGYPQSSAYPEGVAVGYPAAMQQQFRISDDAVLRSGSVRMMGPPYPGSEHRQSPGMGVRPTMPPPAPPGGGGLVDGRVAVSNNTVVQGSMAHYSPVAQQSAVVSRERTSGGSGGQRDSLDLPPPPTPPHTDVVASLPMVDNLPSPPHILTPPADLDAQLSALPSPPFLPPPPSVFASGLNDGGDQVWDGAGTEIGGVSTGGGDTNSDTSSLVTAAPPDDMMKVEAPLVRDTRSDLLAAIREGIQLRKVEERRQKSEQKQKQVSNAAGRLDVQAIMEAAFEMRRKALEENDSDEDDDNLDGTWSDND